MAKFIGTLVNHFIGFKATLVIPLSAEEPNTFQPSSCKTKCKELEIDKDFQPKHERRITTHYRVSAKKPKKLYQPT